MKQLFLYMIAVLLMVACQSKQNNSGNSKEGAATSELPSLAYTIYTEKSELFAEFRSIVVRDSMKLAGHFTQLGELFSAITDGTITMSLVVGDITVSQESTVSSSPGIFRYAIVPAKVGVGKMVFDIKNKDDTDHIVIENVTVFADVNAAMASAQEEPGGNQISYLKEQAWKVEFANMPVTRQAFNEVIKTTGEILPAQGDEMVITANTNGVITFSGNKSVVGTSVRAGETLYFISGKNLTDGNTETRFTQAKVTYDKAKADFDRAQEWVNRSLVLKAEVSQKYFSKLPLIYLIFKS